MATAGIKVLVVGRRFDLPHEVLHVADPSLIMSSIASFQPDVIVTSDFTPGVLVNAAFEIRKRWVHVDPNAKAADVAGIVEGCYAFSLWSEHQNEKHNPLISVYTGTFNSGDHLRETYQSLRDQTYPNWEWVAVDDHSTDGTWERLDSFAMEDARVRPFRSGRRIGKIGGVKDAATRLCRGVYLVELDHDDMLTGFALDEIKRAFQANPDVGMVYSNFAAFFENGQPHRFNDDFWKERYRETEYHGRKWLECMTPDIYDRFGPHYSQQFGYYLTVGPNHVRAFRASTFRELGGYNAHLVVADDWDLFVRFFLRSKCLRIDRMAYLYRYKDAWSNATFQRNKAIQDHLALGRGWYGAEFERFNAARLAASGEAPCFVVASRTEEDAAKARARLAGQDVHVEVGARSILEAYENGRLRWHGRRRIVYVHDDVEFRDLGAFIDAVMALPPGTHGVCGSAAADALKGPNWWDAPPLAGCVLQGIGGKEQLLSFEDFDHAREVEWLDGLCLVAVDQRWSWKVSGAPAVWHGYDWLACTRTRGDGSACSTIAQPNGPLLLHHGYGRTDRFVEDLEAIRGAAGRAPRCEDVSFVVLDATGTPLTERCLRSIREHAKDAEVVLVANGAEPVPAAPALADKVVRLEANIGFAAGSNRGAMEASRRLVCFLNDDAVFVDDTPVRLAEAVTTEHPIVAPYSDRAKPPQGDVPREAVPSADLFPDAVVGVCMMMPLELFRSLGGFDPRLNTWEDDDLCIRARPFGRPKVVGGTWVAHERHATFKALGLDVAGIMEENGRIFRAKHPKIRVVAIAKDEAAAVEGFFGQFQAVTRDWCLLDTGSTDGTADRARAMGVRVEEAPFEDFARTRNEALARFAGGADWIVMLDPDERLDPHTVKHLRETLAGARHDVLLAPLEAAYPDGSRKMFVPKPFAFRPDRSLSWTFKVHEKLVGSQSQAVVPNALIEHVLGLHAPERRARSEELYRRLAAEEPYFTDACFRNGMRERWPILDYDHTDDDRLGKVHAGPLVSAVVPTYRRSVLLRKAVDSALRQDYANLEVVVVGDACPEIAPEMFAHEPRVRTLNLPKNHGAGGAMPRNYGIMAAAGGLVAYLDDDNEWTPGHVSSLYALMRRTGAPFVFSSMSIDDVDLRFHEPVRGGIDTSCVMHTRDLIARHGWWKGRDEVGYAHDWEFFSRWVDAGEKWACTGAATLKYNVKTSGQEAFVRALAEAKRGA
jgi:glycosyltransferase involved in cell wall biosynthesis